MYGVTRVYLPLFDTLAEPPVHLSSCQQTQLQGHTLLKPAIPEVSLPPPPSGICMSLWGHPGGPPGCDATVACCPPPPPRVLTVAPGMLSAALHAAQPPGPSCGGSALTALTAADPGHHHQAAALQHQLRLGLTRMTDPVLSLVVQGHIGPNLPCPSAS
jgi:hypothetical protein